MLDATDEGNTQEDLLGEYMQLFDFGGTIVDAMRALLAKISFEACDAYQINRIMAGLAERYHSQHQEYVPVACCWPVPFSSAVRACGHQPRTPGAPCLAVPHALRRPRVARHAATP